jgi:hypothetical protein
MKITDKSLVSINLVVALLGGVAWLVRISDKLEHTKEIVERNERFHYKTHEAVKQCQRDILESKIKIKYLHKENEKPDGKCLGGECSGF